MTSVMLYYDTQRSLLEVLYEPDKSKQPSALDCRGLGERKDTDGEEPVLGKVSPRRSFI